MAETGCGQGAWHRKPWADLVVVGMMGGLVLHGAWAAVRRALAELLVPDTMGLG